jgi:type VI secretion system protein
MGLKLTLRESGTAGQQETRVLTSGTLSFGRGAGNDWVLPDPERIISKTHCVISAEHGSYILTDVSANGIYLNGATQATARHSRITLTDGDKFRLGNYTVSVTELDDADAPANRPTTERSGGGATLTLGGPQGAGPLDIDPLEDPLGRPPDPAFSHPFVAPSSGRRGEDPFDQRRPGNADDSLLIPRGADPNEEWQGPSEPDHAAAPVHAFAAPKVFHPEDPNEIDFDALLGDLSPIPQQAAKPEPTTPTPVDMRAALEAFLEGAGVAELLMKHDDPAAALRTFGAVFRVMVEGVREVLMSRTAVKGELRIEQTMIRPHGNNALKFAVTPDEAVIAMLRGDRPGYMPALDAAKEAFADLKSHELAVMAGVQAALMGLLRRFDPEALEARLGQGPLSAFLPAARRARYWDSFRQTYGGIAREAEDDFQAVFGRAFARAYAEYTGKN